MSALPSPSRRRLVLVVSILLFAAVRWWSAAGADWSRMRNPDEETICRWIGQVRTYGYPAERVYPGGWFQLFRLRMAFDRAADALVRHKVRRTDGQVVDPLSRLLRGAPPLVHGEKHLVAEPVHPFAESHRFFLPFRAKPAAGFFLTSALYICKIYLQKLGKHSQ